MNSSKNETTGRARASTKNNNTIPPHVAENDCFFEKALIKEYFETITTLFYYIINKYTQEKKK